jgi:hypothetical protein
MLKRFLLNNLLTDYPLRVGKPSRITEQPFSSVQFALFAGQGKKSMLGSSVKKLHRRFCRIYSTPNSRKVEYPKNMNLSVVS